MNECNMVIHIWFQFYKIPFIDYLAMAEYTFFKLFKGNNSNPTDAIFRKLYVHSRVIMTHIYFKFY